MIFERSFKDENIFAAKKSLITLAIYHCLLPNGVSIETSETPLSPPLRGAVWRCLSIARIVRQCQTSQCFLSTISVHNKFVEIILLNCPDIMKMSRH